MLGHELRGGAVLWPSSAGGSGYGGEAKGAREEAKGAAGEDGAADDCARQQRSLAGWPADLATNRATAHRGTAALQPPSPPASQPPSTRRRGATPPRNAGEGKGGEEGAGRDHGSGRIPGGGRDGLGLARAGKRGEKERQLMKCVGQRQR